MRKVWTYGLCLVLLVAVGTAGCATKPPPTPPPPDDNVCNWPGYCHPLTAEHMLNEIRELAEADAVKDAIDPQDLEAIHQHVQRSLDPMLKNAAGRHVCHLQNPQPCAELAQIHAMTSDMPPKPEARKGRWHTIAEELGNFPTGQ